MRKMKKYGRGNRKHEIIREVNSLPVNASKYQTLPERIRFLRVRARPYMTQTQLAQRAGVHQDLISRFENADPKHLNMELNTLRKIAHALGCHIFVNIRPRPSKNSEECQPLGHTLPPLPEWKGKMREIDHTLAAKYDSYPWQNGRPSSYRAIRNRTAYKNNLVAPPLPEEPTE